MRQVFNQSAASRGVDRDLAHDVSIRVQRAECGPRVAQEGHNGGAPCPELVAELEQQT